ncbi:MAG: hypothetical protein FD137_2194 [Spirochaetes bacterium]|nr:MAG: hypothetical protein FD137_2194 [Spirochaetota bacterium]
MALIKSALELALEKTKDLTLDNAALEANKAKTEGRKTGGAFLASPEDTDIDAAIKAANPEHREIFRKAIFEVLVAQIQLPSGIFDPDKFKILGKGLGSLAGMGNDKKVVSMVRNISNFVAKYLEEVKRVEQTIRTQWAPKLKEKERQLAARMGQDVRLDPMSDPEFSAYYKQNFENLRATYSQALEGAKVDLASLCGFEVEA